MEVRIVHIDRQKTEQDNDERDRNRRALRSILEVLMALSAQVAAALEQARRLPNVVDAVNAGFASLSKQVADLKDQIVNQSPSLSEEDKTALAEVTTDLQESIARMPQNIVAGTNQTGGDGNTGVVPEAPPVQNDPTPPTPTEDLNQPALQPEQPAEQAPVEQPPANPNPQG